MTHRRSVLFISIILIFALASFRCGGKSAREKAFAYALLTMEQQGHADSTVMMEALKSQDIETRLRAVKTCGIIRDNRFAPQLGEYCWGPDRQVQLASMFALGEMKDSASAEILKKFTRNTNLNLAEEANRALGKIGYEPFNAGISSGTFMPRWDYVELIYSYWRQDRKNRIRDLKLFLPATHNEVQYAFIYVMFRLQPDSCRPEFASMFDQKASDETRAIAARGLAAAGDSIALLSIFDKYFDSLGKSSRVELIKALGSLKIGRDKLENLLDQPLDSGLRREAILALGQIGNVRSLSKVTPFLADSSLQVRLAAIDAIPDIAKLSGVKLIDKYIDDPLWQIRAETARALGKIGGSNSEKRLKKMLADSDSRVRSAVLESLGEFPITRNFDLFKAALLGSTDPVIKSVAADLLGSSKNSRAFDLLLQAAEQVDSTCDIDYCRSMVSALGNYVDTTESGHTAIAAIMPFLNFPNRIVRQDAYTALKDAAPANFNPGKFDVDPDTAFFDLVLKLEKSPTIVVMETSRGKLTVELDPANAPLTVANFVRLADRKFYDDLTFHRVVQNFVVQGGCPRGDGWGGPGYMIREEINPRRFERGTIGMATSGRDTGGSQFFFCLSAQPHLDGRYTAFGEIIDGWDTLDRIEIGDTIYSVTIEKGR